MTSLIGMSSTKGTSSKKSAITDLSILVVGVGDKLVKEAGVMSVENLRGIKIVGFPPVM
jgi:hypothetical protein